MFTIYYCSRRQTASIDKGHKLGEVVMLKKAQAKKLVSFLLRNRKESDYFSQDWDSWSCFVDVKEIPESIKALFVKVTK